MRVVIFGGSFNPVHTGHAIIAAGVAQLEEVDEVWMMVSPQNPFKSSSDLLPEDERLRLVRLVASEIKGVEGSDFEFSLKRPSFTYDTLCCLREKYPQHEFTLLIGSDNWKVFDKWRDPEKIIEEFGVLIYQRPDDPVNGPFPKGVRLIEGLPVMLLSSSYIRKCLKEGKDVRFLVPDIVYKELKDIRAYGE